MDLKKSFVAKNYIFHRGWLKKILIIFLIHSCNFFQVYMFVLSLCVVGMVCNMYAPFLPRKGWTKRANFFMVTQIGLLASKKKEK